MTKQTKVLLGVGAVALIGYFVWKSQRPKANISGRVWSARKIHIINR